MRLAGLSTSEHWEQPSKKQLNNSLSCKEFYFFSPWGWEEGTGNNGSKEKICFKVQLALAFIISWFLFQSKSNLNPDAKEFIPGVKYWADRKLWGELGRPHIWGRRCTKRRSWRGGRDGQGVHSGERGQWFNSTLWLESLMCSVFLYKPLSISLLFYWLSFGAISYYY